MVNPAYANEYPIIHYGFVDSDVLARGHSPTANTGNFGAMDSNDAADISDPLCQYIGQLVDSDTHSTNAAENSDEKNRKEVMSVDKTLILSSEAFTEYSAQDQIVKTAKKKTAEKDIIGLKEKAFGNAMIAINSAYAAEENSINARKKTAKKNLIGTENSGADREYYPNPFNA